MLLRLALMSRKLKMSRHNELLVNFALRKAGLNTELQRQTVYTSPQLWSVEYTNHKYPSTWSLFLSVKSIAWLHSPHLRGFARQSCPCSHWISSKNRIVRKGSDIREVHCSGLLTKLFDYHQSSRLIDFIAQYSFRWSTAFPGSVENEECRVRSAECGKRGVWKVRSVESAEYGNVECGKWGVWKMRPDDFSMLWW